MLYQGATNMPKSINEYIDFMESQNKSGSLSRSKNDFHHINDVKQIEKKFGIKKGEYHPSGRDGIKQYILADLRKYYSKEMGIIGKNPNLAFADDGQIMLVAQNGKKSFVTDLNIYNYIE